jgi:hypothetical protein
VADLSVIGGRVVPQDAPHIANTAMRRFGKETGIVAAGWRTIMTDETGAKPSSFIWRKDADAIAMADLRFRADDLHACRHDVLGHLHTELTRLAGTQAASVSGAARLRRLACDQHDAPGNLSHWIPLRDAHDVAIAVYFVYFAPELANQLARCAVAGSPTGLSSSVWGNDEVALPGFYRPSEAEADPWRDFFVPAWIPAAQLSLQAGDRATLAQLLRETSLAPRSPAGEEEADEVSFHVPPHAMAVARLVKTLA